MTESLEVMGLADRQVVMVAHRDTAQPHVHVVVNRVSVEDGRAAKLGNSYLKLSRWAEGYEREQGHIRCPQRVENNAERDRGEWVRCASTKPGRYRRGPGRKSQIRRRQVPAAENPRDVSVVVERVDEQKKWRRVQADRRESYWKLERGQRQQWGALYRRHEQARRDLSQDWGSLNRDRVRILPFHHYAAANDELSLVIDGIPGATLEQCGLPATGYKNSGHDAEDQRRRIVDSLPELGDRQH